MHRSLTTAPEYLDTSGRIHYCLICWSVWRSSSCRVGVVQSARSTTVANVSWVGSVLHIQILRTIPMSTLVYLPVDTIGPETCKGLFHEWLIHKIGSISRPSPWRAGDWREQWTTKLRYSRWSVQYINQLNYEKHVNWQRNRPSKKNKEAFNTAMGCSNPGKGATQTAENGKPSKSPQGGNKTIRDKFRRQCAKRWLRIVAVRRSPAIARCYTTASVDTRNVLIHMAPWLWGFYSYESLQQTCTSEKKGGRLVLIHHLAG